LIISQIGGIRRANWSISLDLGLLDDMQHFAKYCLFSALMTATSSFASGTNEECRDVLTSITRTLFRGDQEATNLAVIRIGLAYRSFLDRIHLESQCNGSASSQRQQECQAFKKNEMTRLSGGTWSENFSLINSAFGSGGATYDFSRSLISERDDRQCKVALQLSVDLQSPEILNEEFFLSCR
jgi:hypothetical protein